MDFVYGGHTARAVNGAAVAAAPAANTYFNWILYTAFLLLNISHDLLVGHKQEICSRFSSNSSAS